MARAGGGFEVRPLRPDDLPAPDPGSRHAARTDPEGSFLALDPEKGPVGRASGVVRGETLQLVRLEVRPEERGRGAGTALLDAVKAYGRARGAKALETVAPAADAGTLGFLLRRGVPARSLAFDLAARAGDVSPGPLEGSEVTLAPLAAEGLSGWVADLDRETRGFVRTPDWIEWLGREGVDGWALKRRGRPEGVAVQGRNGSRAFIGPIEARSAAAVAEVIPVLARRAVASGARSLTLLVPAEARPALQAGLGSGFRVAATWAVLSTRVRGDPRRYVASGEGLF